MIPHRHCLSHTMCLLLEHLQFNKVNFSDIQQRGQIFKLQKLSTTALRDLIHDTSHTLLITANVLAAIKISDL